MVLQQYNLHEKWLVLMVLHHLNIVQEVQFITGQEFQQWLIKNLKKTLHLAALSTIRLENDLAKYYQRKVEEGKNKMSVLNAVRNKIIHRIYAIIKNNSTYNFNLEMS